MYKIISLRAGETKLVEGNTLVNSSKSFLWALKSRDKLSQSFNRINKIVMNLNIMYEHLSKLEIIVYKN